MAIIFQTRPLPTRVSSLPRNSLGDRQCGLRGRVRFCPPSIYPMPGGSHERQPPNPRLDTRPSRPCLSPTPVPPGDGGWEAKTRRAAHRVSRRLRRSRHSNRSARGTEVAVTDLISPAEGSADWSPTNHIYIYMPLSWPLGPVVDNHGTEQAQFPDYLSLRSEMGVQ